MTRPDTSAEAVENLADMLPDCRREAPGLFRAAETLRALAAERDALLHDLARLKDSETHETNRALAAEAERDALKASLSEADKWENLHIAATTAATERAAALAAENKALREALEWYEQKTIGMADVQHDHCRWVNKKALAEDMGRRARAALDPRP